MRLVVQRCATAEVRVSGEVVGAIGRTGLVILVGVTHDDAQATAARMAEKVWRLRIFEGEQSADQLGAPMLVVSQFTLYADTRKGRRPSWNTAAPRAVSEPLVSSFVEALRALGAEVATGVFGADMQVSLVNDGPVTLILDSTL
jgi:D-tyrosyl-tRNA(Tyr) deacylase